MIRISGITRNWNNLNLTNLLELSGPWTNFKSTIAWENYIESHLIKEDLGKNTLEFSRTSGNPILVINLSIKLKINFIFL